MAKNKKWVYGMLFVTPFMLGLILFRLIPFFIRPI